MILVLAGTSEGRQAASTLERNGLAVIASTATTYGGELLRQEFRGEITARPLDLEAMLTLIKKKRISSVLDATHPYATEVTATAVEACRQAGIPYERMERAASDPETLEGVIEAGSIEEAAKLASAYSGNIFLTTGSSKLAQYTAVIDPSRLVVRILPVIASLEKCLAQQIPPANIIAMHGPFSEELNRTLFTRYEAAAIITKESGHTGGTFEKIKAAHFLNIPVILLARPKT
ncbi:MAG: precorrin-6A reductase [Bacillota bacterium]|nr:precorrin-6A reductase [Bacillota bacterium]